MSSFAICNVTTGLWIIVFICLIWFHWVVIFKQNVLPPWFFQCLWHRFQQYSILYHGGYFYNGRGNWSIRLKPRIVHYTEWSINIEIKPFLRLHHFRLSNDTYVRKQFCVYCDNPIAKIMFFFDNCFRLLRNCFNCFVK